MHDNERTRRRVLATTAAAAGLGLAGCTGSEGGESADDEMAADESSEDESMAEGSADAGYEVTMEPVGTVEFEEVPERWFSYTGDYADMGVALGQADGLLAVGIKDRLGSGYYEELPGVSVDKDDLTQLWQDGTDKELFYELNADVHLIDPNFMINRIQWSQEDIDEVDSNVAPFVGNTIFSGSYPWHEDYTYYSLLEAFERVAEVFQERERFEAFAAVHEDVQATVAERLPDDRPEVAVLFPLGEDEYLPYVIDSGTSFKQWTDLGVTDAIGEADVEDFHESRGSIDYETLLDIDPEYIAIRHQGKISAADFDETYVAPMRNDDSASDLQAVQNDRVIRGGMPYQGPIISLFQLEQAAQDLYPDAFGGEELFDRGRVADIVTGEF